MAKVITCYCDYCKRLFYSGVYKEGDEMNNKDHCPDCEVRRK